ncbi:hypothetical protein [Vagococcus sp. WN89Y]|uniref:hypothetical protein n=1 Tax=Vagococcus sp. WN89Y TaxID=3457258 RepID=UPI003FCDCB44
MKPMPVERSLTHLTPEVAATAKPGPVTTGFAASIADVANADEKLRTLNNCFQVTANVQKAFSRLLASDR